MVQHRLATSMPQAFVAPMRSWMYRAEVVSGYSFHSSPMQRMTSISSGSRPVRASASSAALAPISWVPSSGPGTGLRTTPSLSTTACSDQVPPVASEMSRAVMELSGRYSP